MHIYPARFATVFTVETYRHYVHRLYAHVVRLLTELHMRPQVAASFIFQHMRIAFRICLYIHYFELGYLMSSKVLFTRQIALLR